MRTHGLNSAAGSQKTDSFADVLRKWLVAEGFDDFGDAGPRFGVSRQTIYNWLSGKGPLAALAPVIAPVLGWEVANLASLVERSRPARKAREQSKQDGARDVAARPNQRQQVVDTHKHGPHVPTVRRGRA